MGKNKKNKMKETGKQTVKAGQQPGDKKQKRDGKHKKAKEIDHLKHIPSKLREIMKSKDRMKAGSLKPKKVKKSIPRKSKAKNSLSGDIPVPHFKRRKRESEKAYIRRMHAETQHVMFLTKNQVERKPELAADEQEKPADAGKSEKKKEYNKARVQKQQLKKLDKQEEQLEKEKFIDDIAFGEVSMAPPSLSARPRKAPVKSQGSKGLLLNSLLGQKSPSTAKPSMARQRIVEEERERAVEAYRQLKRQKQQQHEASVAALGKLKNPQ